MKTKKLESLKEFEVKNSNLSKVKGGMSIRIAWMIPGPGYETFDIGTYVDGFNMGTDGYRD
jgi:hypothetical protein